MSTVTEIIPGQLFHFRLFTKAECADVLAQIDAQRARHGGAPNSMNRYGVLLGGRMKGVLRDLVDDIVRPFALDEGVFLKNDPYAFAVDYSPETQKSLKTHVDSSDMTLNVCLGTKFTGGNLVCYPKKGPAVEVEQRVGYAVVHRGDLAHRAMSLKSGSRTNLVLWCFARKNHRV